MVRGLEGLVISSIDHGLMDNRPDVSTGRSFRLRFVAESHAGHVRYSTVHLSV